MTRKTKKIVLISLGNQKSDFLRLNCAEDWKKLPCLINSYLKRNKPFINKNYVIEENLDIFYL